MTKLLTSRALCGFSLLFLSAACGGRPAVWDASFDPGQAPSTDPSNPGGSLQVRGLQGSVALLDPSLNQVMMLTSPNKLELSSTRLPVGRDVVDFETSVQRDRLFVLSRGVTPRYKATDEPPQLRVFDGGAGPQQLQNYVLQDPYNQLEIDPLGEWLIVHGSEGLVSNPNELILVHLPKDGDAPGTSEEPTSKTLDSYGGKPVRFTFTSELTVPGVAPRRLLVVQREKDLAVIDLADPKAAEITVGLKQNDNGVFSSPADVVYHTGIDGEVNSMLAVQLQGDSDVELLSINAATDANHAFSLHPNLVDVGGTPSKLDFVQTKADGGLRLAALVPSKSSAMLVEPSTGQVLPVPLGAPFTKIRRITDDVVESSGQDIALLYGETTNTIAFWRLGTTTGTPYRSIDAYDLGIQVGQVFDIPGKQFADHKILGDTTAGAARQFYVLDLTQRKSFPLDALTNLTLNLSPTGTQLWAYGSGAAFAQLTFDPLQPASLYTQRPIVFVHDFAVQNSDKDRSAIALHITADNGHSTASATLFDGLSPNTAQTKFFAQLELMGIN